MDQLVLDSLKKWPNVPFCYSWLALDRRGEWRMRNEFAQQHQLPGDVIRHAALKEFIERNFARDCLGQFFFQNGPQRVFVDLVYTPWIARLIPKEMGWSLQTTSGIQLKPNKCLLDEQGQILIEAHIPVIQEKSSSPTSFENDEILSVALLHDHDLEIFSGLAQITQNACSLSGKFAWNNKYLEIENVLSTDIPKRYQFIQKPHA